MKPDSAQDPMWDEFPALWIALHQVADGFTIAGGYGLYLKQTWLNETPSVPTVVALADWQTNIPRATQDFDFIIGLDIIASEASHRKVRQALASLDYAPTAANPYWQFEKTLGGGRTISLDLHAQLPSGQNQGVVADNTRVKRKKSLHHEGIHAHTNPEAVGSELHPSIFALDGVHIRTPNPVTWCIMKLTAMRDQWNLAQQPALPTARSRYALSQFTKHTQDICRIVAMTTRNERDTVNSVIDQIHTTPQFNTARKVRTDFLQPQTGIANDTVADQWSPADMATIQGILAEWFS